MINTRGSFFWIARTIGTAASSGDMNDRNLSAASACLFLPSSVSAKRDRAATLVAMPPGCTDVTPMLVSASSTRNDSLSPRTANFEAQYDEFIGIPMMPKTLERFTMCASSARRSIGRNSLHP